MKRINPLLHPKEVSEEAAIKEWAKKAGETNKKIRGRTMAGRRAVKGEYTQTNELTNRSVIMKSKSNFTKAEADEIIKLIKEKLKAEPTKQKGIRNKVRNIGFYASDYGFRDGYTIEQFLSVAKIVDGQAPLIKPQPAKAKITLKTQTNSKTKSRYQSDECYVIDLCNEVLKQTALRQHRFDFLTGDSGAKLPVDAWYPSLNLVVEFKEKQHTEAVKFFDRRQTVSGMGRGEQRKLYDQRRRDVLPKQGIKLIELDYSDFGHTKGKKLIRSKEEDLKVINKKLEKILKTNNRRL